MEAVMNVRHYFSKFSWEKKSVSAFPFLVMVNFLHIFAICSITERDRRSTKWQSGWHAKKPCPTLDSMRREGGLTNSSLSASDPLWGPCSPLPGYHPPTAGDTPASAVSLQHPQPNSTEQRECQRQPSALIRDGWTWERSKAWIFSGGSTWEAVTLRTSCLPLNPRNMGKDNQSPLLSHQLTPWWQSRWWS